MKNLLTSLLLFFSIQAMAGGFLWPKEDYAYAKLFLFNIPFEGGDKMDFDIYANGIYAKTKIGNGEIIDEASLNKIHSSFARGVDELLMGLSSCFIPRHGIIYFDKNDLPVASLSICLECERIRFWSSTSTVESHKDPKDFDLEKAESQIKTIKEVISQTAYPVFKRPERYNAFVDSAYNTSFNAEMKYYEDPKDSTFSKNLSKGQVWLWIHPDHRATKEFEETVQLKITAGGDKYHFPSLTDHKGTMLMYSDTEESYLTEGKIKSNKMILPNGISIGMSVEQVLNAHTEIKVESYPDRINASYGKYAITYYFSQETLIQIVLTAK